MCGITSDYNEQFFEWHHTNPNEIDIHVSRLLGTNNIEMLHRELAKTECLCPNCHKVTHLTKWGYATIRKANDT